MKTFKTILAAAFITGSAGLAMAQSGGTSGAGAADSTQQGTMKDADKNPTGAGANPQAGNTDTKSQGAAKTGTTGGALKTAPVAGTPSKDELDAGAGADGRQEVIFGSVAWQRPGQ